MHLHKFLPASLLRLLAVFLLFALLVPAPAFSLDSEDSQIFITGFNAYQKKNYPGAIENMSTLLKKYPDTPLRDMAIFWLARANYKAGNQQEAAKYMAQFLKEYPDNPLKGTVEEGLVDLAQRYQRGELQGQQALPKGGAVQAPVATKILTEPVPAETVVSEKPERPAADSAAAEKAAAEKAAILKAAADHAAAEKAAAEKAAAEKAAAEKAAAEKTAAARAAAEKAAAEKAAAEKAAAEKAVAEKAAAEKAAAEKAAAEKAAAEKAAAEKAAAEKAAAEKAAAEKAAAEKAAAEKVAAAKAAAERAAAERAAAERAAAEKSKKQRQAKGKKVSEKEAKAAALRDKAIEGYKAVIDKFPGTPAAVSASVKLRQLGIEYPASAGPVAGAVQGEVTQVFNLEVAQFSNVDVQLGPAAETQEVGKQFIIPIDIINTGNGNDSFYLESGFPAAFGFHFAAAATPDQPITSTPSLAANEKFRAAAVGTIPRSNIDGEKNAFPVKIVSAFAKEVSQSREIALISSAPLLRAVVKSDKMRLLPGEKVSYRISLLNIGTAGASGVSLRLNYPPQYEPIEYPASLKQVNKDSLVLDDLQLRSGESKDINLNFRLKDEALADQELFLRADVVNTKLDKKESFVSSTSVVQKISGVTAKTTADKFVVIPGQVVAIPLIVTNTGNVREVFNVKGSIPSGTTYTYYDDLNRDGKRQANEPIINHVGPLSPKEEAYIILEVATPTSASDGAVAPLTVGFEPESAAAKTAMVNLQLTYSRPILELALAAKGGRLKPGEVSSLELSCVNRGSNMAKLVTLQSILPSQLELVASEPGFTQADSGVYTWRFDELGAGEKRNIKVTYRVKPGIAVGTSMQLKNLLNYQDLLGNRY